MFPSGSTDAEESDALDVDRGIRHVDLDLVVVERPMWDIELPPRYDGGRDWET